MEQAPADNHEATGTPDSMRDFYHAVADFLDLEDGSVLQTALDAAASGEWGYIPASSSGYEWPFTAPDGSQLPHNPQRTTMDSARLFAGRTVTQAVFDEFPAARAALLASGEPFGTIGEDGRVTVWHGPVQGSTGPWPLFRRFILPEQPAAENTEIGPADYAVVPYLRLPRAD